MYKKSGPQSQNQNSNPYRNGTNNGEAVINYSSEDEDALQTKSTKHTTHSRPRENTRTRTSDIALKKVRNGVLNIPSPVVVNSPSGSQSHRCISRKSLREIPQDDVRLSHTQKQYDVAKYQMEDLTESFERQMLQSLRRQTMEEDYVDDEEVGKADMQRLHYNHDNSSDSSDDNSMDTLKGHVSMMIKIESLFL